MMKIGVSSTSGRTDPTVLAELVSRRWNEARPYYTLNRTARGVWLDALWRRQVPQGSASWLSTLRGLLVRHPAPLQNSTRGDPA